VINYIKDYIGDVPGKNNATFSTSCQMHVQANTTVSSLVCVVLCIVCV
jgi:hypothetical protein